MIPLQELHAQNHQLAELTKVLRYLFQDREMCDTDVACELLERYTAKIDAHMTRNRKIYSVLLARPDGPARAMAHRFIEGEKEIKRLFKDYQARWCKNGLRINDHTRFLDDTEDMFDLLRERIQAETEQLYPLARTVDAQAETRVA
ncbi:MAG: hypothetical protein KDE22_08060 [Rhodobacterales bacterium]|nr:hypothetical protein [Rhodobacterales bacterium]